ncbi:putative ankyrin repeat protein RF_0381 [Helicoverpa zea]|uniref:putative ankyrin repeat protein RF_0381 n=1 Tax=Helicoverpa zea TaxID=7113 RepID=UPI001F5AC35D|nr:putative ankyrin repeat protein RF_0381 [Helicoverpa zea]
MSLQEFLVAKFTSWSPPEPEVLKRTKYSISLAWRNVEPFHFIADQLLYRLEKNDKMPPWIVVYRGGKTSKEIDNLASRNCHKFRLKVIVKATAVPSLAERAVQFYGDEATVYDKMKVLELQNKTDGDKSVVRGAGDAADTESHSTDTTNKVKESGDDQNGTKENRSSAHSGKWLESRWSALTWGSTDTDGTSAVCFCMAVRCGYIKQVQGMLDERPALIGIVNSSNGFTPLATAVRKGDINTVRFLVLAGAELEQRSGSGQTALHLAVLGAHVPIALLLLDQGADFQARDLNGLRVEHYAVDSGDVATLRFILDRGGDVHAEDNHGWTPLFRALCQSASTEMIEELVSRGSALGMADRAGLPLASVARLLVDAQGRTRESVLRLVDSSYPHEKALANFTRLTKKIYNVHSLLKLPTPKTSQNITPS